MEPTKGNVVEVKFDWGSGRERPPQKIRTFMTPAEERAEIIRAIKKEPWTAWAQDQLAKPEFAELKKQIEAGKHLGLPWNQ